MTGGLGNKRMSRDHPNYNMAEISQNTEKSPGDFEEICCHSNSYEKPSANTGIKTLKRVKFNNIKMRGMKCIDLVKSALFFNSE